MIKYLKNEMINYLRHKSKFMARIVAIREKQIFNRRKKRFHEEADTILKKFIQYSNDCGVKTFLFYGTLLGAYRDHDFIKHDFDMDFGVRSQEELSILKKNISNSEFKLTREYFIPDEGTHIIKFAYKGVVFDIFYIANDGELLSSYCFEDVRDIRDGHILCIPEKYSCQPFDLTEIEFRGVTCLIPSNCERVLASLYGDDFMIPDPNHEFGSGCEYKTSYVYWEKPGFCRVY